MNIFEYLFLFFYEHSINMGGGKNMLNSAPDTMTVKEAAKVLRCGRTKLMQLIYDGYIEARMICGKYIILKEDLIEYIHHC